MEENYSSVAPPAGSVPGLVGEDYHLQITSELRPVRSRADFHTLVGVMVPAGAEILDFGAGTGIDARFLAERGHRVQVFEPHPEMLAYLRHYAAAAIDAGQIAILHGLIDCAPVDAVIANFAVFNLVMDRPAAFRALHAVVKPGGFILVSLLNPWWVRDARARWWRRNLPRLIIRGGYEVPGANGPIRRVTPQALAREAEPWFRLASVNPAGPAMIRSPFLFARFDRCSC